jgi:hypothetical protein
MTAIWPFTDASSWAGVDEAARELVPPPPRPGAVLHVFAGSSYVDGAIDMSSGRLSRLDQSAQPVRNGQ